MIAKIDQHLRTQGLLPWLDTTAIGVGRKWRDEIQNSLQNVRCAAVFFGPSGIGSFQQMEVYGLVHEMAKRRIDLLPVILDGVKGTPGMDGFLSEYQWIDLRAHERAPGLRELVKAVNRANEKYL